MTVQQFLGSLGQDFAPPFDFSQGRQAKKDCAEFSLALATQYVDRCTNLASGVVEWQRLTTNIPPTAVSTNYTDPNATNSLLFYRVSVKR